VVKEVHSKCTLPYWIKATPLNRKLTKQIKTLDDQLIHPDEYDKSFKEKKSGKFYGKGKRKAGGNEFESGAEASEEIETSKQIKIDKLDILKNKLTDVKELFSEVA
ncbi:hypothetical protein, partial [Vibrio anguillarum]